MTTTATELEEQTADRCIATILDFVVPFHEHSEDRDIRMVLACDLEGLDTHLLVALADALKE